MQEQKRSDHCLAQCNRKEKAFQYHPFDKKVSLGGRGKEKGRVPEHAAIWIERARADIY